MQLVDETYKGMRISPKVVPLCSRSTTRTATASSAWVSPYAPARVVYLQLGHGEPAHRSAAYRDLVQQRDPGCAGRLGGDNRR